MATLYEIDERLKDLMSRAIITEEGVVDSESGEVLNAELLNDLQMEKTEKIDNIGCFIKNLLDDAASYEKEAAWQQDRAKRARKKAEWLTAYLSGHIERGKKFVTNHCEMKWHKSDSVDIFDFDAIPKEYIKIKTKVDTSADKIAIKKAINAGEAVSGAAIKTKTWLTIE